MLLNLHSNSFQSGLFTFILPSVSGQSSGNFTYILPSESYFITCFAYSNYSLSSFLNILYVFSILFNFLLLVIAGLIVLNLSKPTASEFVLSLEGTFPSDLLFICSYNLWILLFLLLNVRGSGLPLWLIRSICCGFDNILSLLNFLLGILDVLHADFTGVLMSKVFNAPI